MKYTPQEVMQFIEEEDVKFIRLAFCDIHGNQKNISIMPTELERAFSHGISIDASAIDGFGQAEESDLYLHPIPSTITILPWRPEHGSVVRMFCDICYPDGKPFEKDARRILQNAIQDAEEKGYTFSFGTEMEFYLFQLDENGERTNVPYDQAGYMDVAPLDKCENVRREICLTLEKMGILPEGSHHEEGPGQNEIDFRYSDALEAADHAITFRNVVQTIASVNGLYADFSPKPLKEKPGNGFHMNISVKEKAEALPFLMAGIMEHIEEMTVVLNPVENSYQRLGTNKAPRYISWAAGNRSQLIRVPMAKGKYYRCELRSPDCMSNPYLAYALLIWAGLEGIEKQLQLPPERPLNLYQASQEELETLRKLPETLEQAKEIARESTFLAQHLPKALFEELL